MSFLDDLLGTASDVATSVLDRAPGGGWVRSAYDQGKTWLLAVAKSPTGSWMIDVVSNAVAIPALLPIVGPAATALWAAPGIVKGEPFSQAYVEGFTKRLVQLAQYLAGQGASEAVQKQAAEAMASQVQQAANDPALQQAIVGLATQQTNDAIRDALVQAHMTPEEVAARLGIRPDAAAFALNLLLKKNVYDAGEFGIADGQRPPPVQRLPGPDQSAGAYLLALQVAKAKVLSLQATADLPGNAVRLASARQDVQLMRGAYEAAISQENANKDGTYWLTQLLQAQQAGAPPDRIAELKRNLDVVMAKESLDGGTGLRKGLTFRLGPPLAVGVGKPSAVVLDVAVVAAAFWLLYRFRR